MTTTSTTNVTEAADHLRALLDLPEQRPGSWEAEHVEALESELRDVFALLDGTGARL